MPDQDSISIKPPPMIGSYQLLQQLGSGGMSSVFRAVHADSGHEVALKVLPRSMAKNSTLLQRFHREAKNAEALSHPNIAEIYDRGSDQGRYYLVLEFVDGGDLHERVRKEGPLPIKEAINVVRQVAEGLKYALSKGVIHRDIKPANLLLRRDGLVKIIDLGLALQLESEDERVTRDGTTVGTVDYMSPEQARDSRATSERSDIYSLGCTLYFFLTGSAPFPGGDVADKLSRHCTAAPPDVCLIRPEVPGKLSRLIQKMMAKRPEKRFQDYDHLIHGLDSILPLLESGGPATLDVLIDEDEDDQPLEAIIDDDESDEGDFLGPDAPRPSSTIVSPKPGGRAPAPPPPPEVSLIELVALDREAPSLPPTRRKPAPAAPPEAPLWAMDDEAEDEIYHTASMKGAPVRRVSSADELPLQTWIGYGVMAGLSIVLVYLAISFLWYSLHDTPDSAGPTAPSNSAPDPQ